jgi:hypothetical protein
VHGTPPVGSREVGLELRDGFWRGTRREDSAAWRRRPYGQVRIRRRERA